jgi:hypothetical protein
MVQTLSDGTAEVLLAAGAALPATCEETGHTCLHIAVASKLTGAPVGETKNTGNATRCCTSASHTMTRVTEHTVYKLHAWGHCTSKEQTHVSGYLLNATDAVYLHGPGLRSGHH